MNRAANAVSGDLDLERLVQTITDAAVEVTGAEFGAFFYNVIDQNSEHFTLYSLSGAPPEAFSKFPMPRSTAIFEPTFSGGGVVRSDDITKDRRYGRSAPYDGMPRDTCLCAVTSQCLFAHEAERCWGTFLWPFPDRPCSTNWLRSA